MANEQSNLEAELGQFTGSQTLFRNFTGLLYSQGIAHLAERGGAYWLIDLVGSYQSRLQDVPFQVWRIEVHEDKSALVTMVEDDGEPTKVEKRIAYSDLPLKDFSFYCCASGDKAMVMMLKGEY